MPFRFTPEQAGGNIGHQVLVARNVQRCDRADLLDVEPQGQDPDQLLRDKAGVGNHALHPADCWAIVVEYSYLFFGEGATDMLHHEP
jgi:hypothetical protein